jgi:hypothetical protein
LLMDVLLIEALSVEALLVNRPLELKAELPLAVPERFVLP